MRHIMSSTGEPSDETWAAELMVTLLHYAELFEKTGLDIEYDWLETMAQDDYQAFLEVTARTARARAPPPPTERADGRREVVSNRPPRRVEGERVRTGRHRR